MSIGGISGSRYESMRTQFESFRSGNSKIQKSDLEELKTTLSSADSADGSAAGIDELIENYSQINTNGDGISVDELDGAAQSGVLSGPQKSREGPGGMKGPPPGPPPGGRPGGPQGTNETDDQKSQTEKAQSNLLGYSLYEEFLRKLQEQTESASPSSSSDAAESATGSLSGLSDALSEENGSSEAASSKDGTTSLTKGEANVLARMLNQQIMQAYGRSSSWQQMAASSLLGEGVTA